MYLTIVKGFRASASFLVSFSLSNWLSVCLFVCHHVTGLLYASLPSPSNHRPCAFVSHVFSPRPAARRPVVPPNAGQRHIRRAHRFWPCARQGGGRNQQVPWHSLRSTACRRFAVRKRRAGYVNSCFFVCLKNRFVPTTNPLIFKFVAVQPWNTTKKTTEHGNQCPQVPPIVLEHTCECFGYLNTCPYNTCVCCVSIWCWS